jgi:hypothetical protein
MNELLIVVTKIQSFFEARGLLITKLVSLNLSSLLTKSLFVKVPLFHLTLTGEDVLHHPYLSYFDLSCSMCDVTCNQSPRSIRLIFKKDSNLSARQKIPSLSWGLQIHRNFHKS